MNLIELERYLAAGFDVIPLYMPDYVDSKGRDRGKSPLHEDWRNRAYTKDGLLAAAKRGANMGWRLGAEDLVLDVDPRNFEEGDDPLARLCEHTGLDLDKYPHVVTGSGGHHYYMRKPEDLPTVDSLPDFRGVEFKTRGRQVVIAGSVHPSGPSYHFDDMGPTLYEITDAPERLLATIRRPSRPASAGGGPPQVSPEELAEMLQSLDPGEYQDHEKWLQMMMACHHATSGEGRQEFIDWSTQDPEFATDAWIIGRRWDSLHRDRSDGITARTLFKAVLEAGGSAPMRTDPANEFTPKDMGAPSAPGADEPSLVERMNARHACVVEAGKFRIYTRAHDPVLDRHHWVKSSRRDFVDSYEHRRVPVDDGVTKSYAEVWLLAPGRQQYDEGVIFDPSSRARTGYLNLWTGWSVEPKRGDWSRLQRHIDEVMCPDSSEHSEYVYRWLAHMVQRPWVSPEVCLAFRGERGTGKSTLGKVLCALAGPHGLPIANSEHLVGRFNAHLRDCLVLFVDEGFWAGDKRHLSVLKQLITEPVITYEGKGIDAVSGANMVHVVIASNEDWTIPATLHGERRFAAFSVSNSKRVDSSWFGPLYQQMFQDGGLAAMLYDLLEFDLGDWHPRVNPPESDELAEQKMQGLDELEEWWFETLDRGVLPRARGDWRNGRTSVICSLLHDDYLRRVDKASSRWTHRGTATRLGKRLSQLVPGLEKVRLSLLPDELEAMADAGPLGRANAWIFPSLDRCREAFVNMLGSNPWKDYV